MQKKPKIQNLLAAVGNCIERGHYLTQDMRLTGNEVRFIRQHFDMTLQEFAKRFGATHPGVLKWEVLKDKPTGMNWATEKDIRLFALLKLTSKSIEIVDLYKMLEEMMNTGKPVAVEIDARKLAA